jgi:hypothetical protein
MTTVQQMRWKDLSNSCTSFSNLLLVCFYNFEKIIEKFKFLFYIFSSNYFFIFLNLWCTVIKNKFKKIKNIISIYFEIKNTLKINYKKNSYSICDLAVFELVEIWNSSFMMFISNRKLGLSFGKSISLLSLRN